MTGPRRPARPRRPVRRPGGRLPQSVYWRRRITLLTVAAVLVIGLVALLHHGGSSGSGRASEVSAVTAPSPRPHSSRPVQPASVPTTPSSSTTPSAVISALPNGDCRDSDVVVTPSASAAVPGQAVPIQLAISSASTPTCTWTLNRDSVQVAVKRAGGEVWSTAICRSAVPTETLTLTPGSPAYVTITWGGHVATDSCSVHDPWAARVVSGQVVGLGTYKVQAAALGGRPASTTFQMAAPVETVAPTPSTSPSSKASSQSPSSTTAAKHAKHAKHKRHKKHRRRVEDSPSAGASASAGD